MDARKAIGVGAAFVATAAVFFLIGRLTRPVEDWSKQYVNRAADPREYDNPFHGVRLRAPAEGEWLLAWKPADFRFPTPATVNKVLEIERLVKRGDKATPWARMDLFVEALSASRAVRGRLKVLEFREKRPGFHIVSEEPATVAGLPAKVRIARWAVANRHYASVNYYLVRGNRLFAFIGVCDAERLDQVRPLFDQIISSVRFE